MEIGIDISNHQGKHGPLDFDAIREAGYTFVGMKLTEGVNYIDPSVQRMAPKALAAGLDLFYYHFATPGGSKTSSGYKEWWDAGDEARDFIAALDQVPPATMRNCLDFEWHKIDLSPEKRTEWACEWLEIVDAAVGYPMQFYSYVNYLDEYMKLPSAPINAHPLWLAHYNVPEPAFREEWGWAEEDFFIWQHSSDGEVPGIPVHTDLNRAMRDLTPLRFEAPAQAFEYHVEELRAQSRSRASAYQVRLNELGADGWDLVHLDMPSVARTATTPEETRMAVLKRTKP